jgi:BCD family chlorophyll transporter-like MFS transporter
MDNPRPENLPIGRNIKIGLFHLGSGMADVISTGVWNRIMISDLGFAATPVGFLLALRYFLAPLGVWAGRMSDRRTLGGYRRLSWVWLGRGMMALSVLALGLTTATIARGDLVDALDWIVLTAALLLFSLGSALSSSTFLALIYDRSPEHQRGRAVGIVWTFLLLGFTVGGFGFAALLPSSESGIERETVAIVQGVDGEAHALAFTPDMIQTLFIVAALVMAGLWFFSILGEEKRAQPGDAPKTQAAQLEGSTSLRSDLRLAWSDRRTRFFFWFLSLSMLFAFTQDLILEPFAADVFGMEPRTTTRFAAYWGSMAILGTVVFLILSRRVKWLSNTIMSYVGVALLVGTYVLFALSSLAEIRGLVTPGLILLGLGLGVWNVGTLGLMMDMSPFGRAGTFLGFWTLVVTLARGFGVSSGGLMRDLGLALTGQHTIAYGVVFIVGAVGLLASIWALSRVRATAFQRDQSGSTAQVLAAALD